MNGKDEYNNIKGLVTGTRPLSGDDDPTKMKTLTGPYSFSSLLDNGDSIPGYDDLYGDLMRKEERVMDTVDRVVNHARLADVEHTSFLKQPLHVIILRLIKTIKIVFEEAVDLGRTPRGKVKWWTRFADLFMKEERKIYVGVLLVILALTVTLVHTGL
jgi:hypothetical protein